MSQKCVSSQIIMGTRKRWEFQNKNLKIKIVGSILSASRVNPVEDKVDAMSKCM